MTTSKPGLILASASPRRRELLAAMGVQFEVVTADVEELTYGIGIGPETVALYNACLKVGKVSKLEPTRWILGADTVVALGEQLLGKPSSLEQAREFLKTLSGRKHQVITACCLFGPRERYLRETFFARTEVTFHQLNDDTIERYLSAVHVLDKAGAYALQEHGDWIIESVEGSRNNVIGLPTELIESVFKRHGLL